MKWLGIRINQAKQWLIDLMYGAKINQWFGKAIIKLVKERASILFDDWQFKTIAEELSKGRRKILRK